MTFKSLFGQINILSLNLINFRVPCFRVSHLTHETVKLGLQNTLNMSKTTRVYFGVLHRTWADLGQDFIRQYSFNTVVDVSRRELEALRQRPDESLTSFISRWREKMAQIIDKP